MNDMSNAAGPGLPNPILRVREPHLAVGAEFANDQSARAARERRSDAVAEWLAHTFATAIGSLTSRAPQDARAGEDTQPPVPSGIALAAVGSLGRRELGPRSDLDLVLLHDGSTLSPAALAELADALWYPIWDAHWHLDHAVRTVAQCLDTARSDVIAAVSLLDLRLIAGDARLVDDARAAIFGVWRRSAHVQAQRLIESLVEREASAGDLATSSEPDLKSARGGLRDATNLQALTATWLADRPRGEADRAQSFLLRVRDAVHHVTNRPTVRLVRADRADVARLCGFADVDDLLTEVSAAGRVLAYAVDTTARRALRANPRGRRLSKGFGISRRPTLTPLGGALVEHAGEISRDAAALGRHDPLLGLRVGAAAARTGLAISPETLDQAAAAPALPEPWPEEARDLLHILLGCGQRLIGVWEALDQHGVTARWFPEWDGIRNRPHHAAVHRYTVDRHSLETVAAAAALVDRVERPGVLLFSALVHDIGKRRGQRDHSAEGAPLAARMARRVGFGPDDVDTVEMLVREHLTLSDLATRRDPAAAGTRAELARAVGWRPDRLDLLRALTEADARGTGGQGWSAWRAHLVDDLVWRVREDLAQHRA
ncbi:HD domain-containing protein [Micrococcales bacterium 31B]|nr:HD domain-containing protein [Micrococcales bacterium 31B]